MFDMGATEIILVIVTLLIILIPVGIALYLIFVLFRDQGRIEALEAKVARLEQTQARETRLDALEGRIEDMKK